MQFPWSHKVRIPESSYIWLSVDSLKSHPDNPNKHFSPQIERLAKIIDELGFRHPIIVSNQSGFIVSGHGRLQALQSLGWTHVPVQYQDFKDEAEEYAVLVSDNAIADWAMLDLAKINNDFHKFGPMDIELLGIKDFDLDPEFEPGTIEEQGQLDQKKLIIMECPHCGESFELDQAEKIK